MSEKVRFVGAAEQKCASFTSLCRSFGIAPKTGYKWVAQFRRNGIAGLTEKSRRPHGNSRAISNGIAERIVDLRKKFPTWGPRKLLVWLQLREPGIQWPAASTVGDLLKERGLIPLPLERRRRFVSPFADSTLRSPDAPNVVWSMDFKGWFLLGDRTKCEPLTITDNFSRYLLCCDVLPTQRQDYVWKSLSRVFREFGLPEAIRVDLGGPWSAVKGDLKLTEFSVALLKLGIAIERIRRPQQNGRHERFHLTLKQDTASPPAKTAPAQQARFRSFQKVFNNERPHESLGMRPPSTAYRPSPREFPSKIPEPEYPAAYDVRRVDIRGDVTVLGHRFFVSSALSRQHIGVLEVEDGCYEVRFCSELLGHLQKKHPELGLIPARTRA